MNSHDGFLSYLQNSTANSAHLAAHFCPALVCPQKATVRIQFLPYFWNPLIKQTRKFLSNLPNTFLGISILQKLTVRGQEKYAIRYPQLEFHYFDLKTPHSVALFCTSYSYFEFMHFMHFILNLGLTLSINRL